MPILSLPVQPTIQSKLSSPSVKNPSNSPPKVSTPSTNSRSDRQVKLSFDLMRPPFFLKCTFCNVFYTEDISNEFLLQQSSKSHELRPLALPGTNIFSLLVTYPNTMTLKETLKQSFRSHFYRLCLKNYTIIYFVIIRR